MSSCDKFATGDNEKTIRSSLSVATITYIIKIRTISAVPVLYKIEHQVKSSLFCHNATSTKRRRETAKDLMVT